MHQQISYQESMMPSEVSGDNTLRRPRHNKQIPVKIENEVSLSMEYTEKNTSK